MPAILDTALPCGRPDYTQSQCDQQDYVHPA